MVVRNETTIVKLISAVTMFTRSSKALLCLGLALLFWVGLSPRMLGCQSDMVKSCCHVAVNPCAVTVVKSCCLCGSAPAHDAGTTILVRAPQPPQSHAIPVCRYPATFEKGLKIARLANDLSGDVFKPPKIYLLKRSLLI